MNVDFADFNMTELMNSKVKEQRRIGYLMASIILKNKTELLTLTVAIFQKDFKNAIKNDSNLSLSLNCFSHLCCKDLAQYLFSDIIPLFNHSSVLVRRKACLTTYKILIAYP